MATKPTKTGAKKATKQSTSSRSTGAGANINRTKSRKPVEPDIEMSNRYEDDDASFDGNNRNPAFDDNRNTKANQQQSSEDKNNPYHQEDQEYATRQPQKTKKPRTTQNEESYQENYGQDQRYSERDSRSMDRSQQ